MKISVLCLLAAVGFTSLWAEPKPAEAPAAKAEKPVATDAFGVGSVWTGQRHFRKDDDGKSRGKGQPWSLHIEERTGDRFTGFVVFGNTEANRVKIAVAGSAPADGAGYVGFSTTEAKGDAKQRFWGAIKNEIVELEFKGRSISGEEVQGVAGLSRKK